MGAGRGFSCRLDQSFEETFHGRVAPRSPVAGKRGRFVGAGALGLHHQHAAGRTSGARADGSARHSVAVPPGGTGRPLGLRRLPQRCRPRPYHGRGALPMRPAGGDQSRAGRRRHDVSRRQRRVAGTAAQGQLERQELYRPARRCRRPAGPRDRLVRRPHHGAALDGSRKSPAATAPASMCAAPPKAPRPAPPAGRRCSRRRSADSCPLRATSSSARGAPSPCSA